MEDIFTSNLTQRNNNEYLSKAPINDYLPPPSQFQPQDQEQLQQQQVEQQHEEEFNGQCPPSSIFNQRLPQGEEEEYEDDNILSDNENAQNGRWKSKEHRYFLKGCILFGNNWKKVQGFVQTRNSAQIRSHAQKYLIKLSKKHGPNPNRNFTETHALDKKYQHTDFDYFMNCIEDPAEMTLVEKFILAKFQPDMPSHSSGQGQTQHHSKGLSGSSNGVSIGNGVVININGSEESVKYNCKRGRKPDVKKKKMKIFHVEKCQKAVKRNQMKMMVKINKMLNSNDERDLERLMKIKEEKRFDFGSYLKFNDQISDCDDANEDIKLKEYGNIINNGNNVIIGVKNNGESYNDIKQVNGQKQQQPQQVQKQQVQQQQTHQVQQQQSHQVQHQPQQQTQQQTQQQIQQQQAQQQIQQHQAQQQYAYNMFVSSFNTSNYRQQMMYNDSLKQYYLTNPNLLQNTPSAHQQPPLLSQMLYINNNSHLQLNPRPYYSHQ